MLFNFNFGSSRIGNDYFDPFNFASYNHVSLISAGMVEIFSFEIKIKFYVIASKDFAQVNSLSCLDIDYVSLSCKEKNYKRSCNNQCAYTYHNCRYKFNSFFTQNL